MSNQAVNHVQEGISSTALDLESRARLARLEKLLDSPTLAVLAEALETLEVVKTTPEEERSKKLQIVFDPHSYGTLERLTALFGKSKADVVRQALDFLSWAMSEQEKGRSLAVVDPSTQTVSNVVLALPPPVRGRSPLSEAARLRLQERSEKMLAEMQTQEARQQMERLFQATPEEFGKAAVEKARSRG